MRVIGFNFTKISAERSPDFKTAKITSSIEFKDLKKENVDVLKDSEALKILFQYDLNYEEEVKKKTEKRGQVAFEGNIILSINKEELKDIMKSWKKKEIPARLKLNLFNLIMKRCAAKSLQLQEDLSLPSHIPIPKLTPKREQPE